MCWWRRHTPLSLPPIPHHQHGFMALQEQDPCPLTHCWTKSDAGAIYPSQIVPLTCSGPWLGAAHTKVTPFRMGDQSWQHRVGMHRLTVLLWWREAASKCCTRTLGQTEDARGW